MFTMTSATPPTLIKLHHKHHNTPSTPYYLHLPNPHNGMLFFPRDEYLNTLYRYEILWEHKFKSTENLYVGEYFPEYLQSLWTEHILHGVVPLYNYSHFLLQHLDTKIIYSKIWVPPEWDELRPGEVAERMTAADLELLFLANCDANDH